MTHSTRWVFEPAHTHIAFSVRHLGLTSTPGIFKRHTAQVDFDGHAIERGGVTFEVEVDSIDTALALRDDHLRGADWFDARRHPRATYVSRAVRRVAGERYVIEGDLTLRGVTLPLDLEAELTGRAVNPWTQAPVLGFAAHGVISRAAYGMGAFPGALSDAVQLRIEAELTRPIEANQ